MVKCPLCREPVDKDKANEHIQNHRPFATEENVGDLFRAILDLRSRLEELESVKNNK
jgi:hypothetical protein